MKNALALVKNLKMLSQAMGELLNRGHGVPGIGIVTGPSGAGKSTGMDWIAGAVNALTVCARPTWSVNSALAAISVECNGCRQNSNNAMVDFTTEYMSVNRRPLIIDEADFLLDKPILLETCRTLYDISKMPILLIGMDKFERRLAHSEQFNRRILQRVRFRPQDVEDTRTYIDAVCEVHVADDLVARIHADTEGSIGHMAVSVQMVETLAKKQGLTEIDSKQWGDRPLVYGRALAAPARKQK